MPGDSGNVNQSGVSDNTKIPIKLRTKSGVRTVQVSFRNAYKYRRNSDGTYSKIQGRNNPGAFGQERRNPAGPGASQRRGGPGAGSPGSPGTTGRSKVGARLPTSVPADYRGQRGAKYFTMFKAEGSLGTRKDLHPKELKGESPSILQDDIDDYEEGNYAAPAAFFSQQYLRKVKFEGILEVELLIDELNSKLQYVGEEEPDFDFRKVYDYWSYNYEVHEKYGGTSVIVARESKRSR